MKVKSVSFSDYALAKIGNENKSYGEIIDIAWRNSEEYLRSKKSRQKTIKFLSIGCFALLTSTLIFSPSTRAFADVLGMETLAKQDSLIVYKLKIACEFYKDCLKTYGLDRSPDLFVEIIKNGFDMPEIYKFVSSAKGLSLEELLQLVPTL